MNMNVCKILQQLIYNRFYNPITYSLISQFTYQVSWLCVVLVFANQVVEFCKSNHVYHELIHEFNIHLKLVLMHYDDFQNGF